MGRGRAKAKQTKVARSLKYRTSDTDFETLGRELRGDSKGGEQDPHIPDQYADLVDQYADPGDEDDDPEGVEDSSKATGSGSSSN